MYKYTSALYNYLIFDILNLNLLGSFDAILSRILNVNKYQNLSKAGD